jgi:hypothetical protein
MERKARAGHVTGGVVFGYDNVRVDGHVERRINRGEAAVVTRSFQLYVAGQGFATIAKLLNADRAAAPKPRRPRIDQPRQQGWSQSSVRDVLYRDLYHGEIVWNRTKKRDA